MLYGLTVNQTQAWATGRGLNLFPLFQGYLKVFFYRCNRGRIRDGGHTKNGAGCADTLTDIDGGARPEAQQDEGNRSGGHSYPGNGSAR